MLYRQGDAAAARERYYMAIELDEDYVEARANLGCVLAETGHRELAVAAFRVPLVFHPTYADVHYHLARTLDETRSPRRGGRPLAIVFGVGPRQPLGRRRRTGLSPYTLPMPSPFPLPRFPLPMTHPTSASGSLAPRGGVAATTLLGLTAWKKASRGPLGLVSALPEFASLPLAAWSDFVVGRARDPRRPPPDEALRLASQNRAIDDRELIARARPSWRPSTAASVRARSPA